MGSLVVGRWPSLQRQRTKRQYCCFYLLTEQRETLFSLRVISFVLLRVLRGNGFGKPSTTKGTKVHEGSPRSSGKVVNLWQAVARDFVRVTSCRGYSL